MLYGPYNLVQFAVITLQFAVIDLQNFGLLWNDLQSYEMVRIWDLGKYCIQPIVNGELALRLNCESCSHKSFIFRPGISIIARFILAEISRKNFKKKNFVKIFLWWSFGRWTFNQNSNLNPEDVRMERFYHLVSCAMVVAMHLKYFLRPYLPNYQLALFRYYGTGSHNLGSAEKNWPEQISFSSNTIQAIWELFFLL